MTHCGSWLYEQGVVSAVGVESAQKPKINNMQDHGWHESAWKAMLNS
jgi:hypothetical protein